MKQTAKNIMLKLAEQWFLMPMKHVHQKPGEAIQSLPLEIRESLEELRSSDLTDVRWPPYGCI